MEELGPQPGGKSLTADTDLRTQRGRIPGPGMSLGIKEGTGGGGIGVSSVTTSGGLSESELFESDGFSRDGELEIAIGHCQHNKYTGKTQPGQGNSIKTFNRCQGNAVGTLD